MLKELREAAAGVMALGACLALSMQMAAQSPAPPSLQEQLEAQYPLSRMNTANGCTLTNPGAALRFQKGGVFAVPATSVVGCPSKYEDGKVKDPNVFCKTMVKQNAGSFQTGDRVYVLKIDANPQKDKVSLSLASCEQGSSWKGEVVFAFPKGSLGKASVTEVEDKIGELLSLENDNASVQSAAPPADQGQPQPQAGDPAQSQPSSLDIQVGQTTQQEVEATLGPPEKRITVGPKQIYLYKNMKITFQDGKVSQVE